MSQSPAARNGVARDVVGTITRVLCKFQGTQVQLRTATGTEALKEGVNKEDP